METKIDRGGLLDFEQFSKRFENWATFARYWSKPCFVAHDARKIPYIGDVNCLNPLKAASVSDPSTWRTAYSVLAAIQADTTGTLVGIGFVLHGDGTVCIDLDHCVDENGNISPEAKRILDRFPNTYAEYSLSGRGIHIWLRTSKPLPEDGRRTNGIEIYQNKRYIAITMDILPNRPQHMEDYTDELHALYHELFSDDDDYETIQLSEEELRSLANTEPGEPDEDDEKLIARFLRKPENEIVWRGDKLPHHPSPSHADCSLAYRLMFYTNGDIDRVKRLFLKSKRANRWKIRNRPDLVDRAVNAAYRGYLRYKSQQLSKPVSKKPKQPAQQETPIDHFVKWFTNCVQPTPSGVVPNGLAYQHYCSYIRSVGQKPLSIKKWAKLMDEKNVRVERRVYNGKYTRCRIGITLVGVEDPFVKWFTNCVQPVPDCEIPNDLAYQHYCDYVRTLGAVPESMARWARHMDEMGVPIVRKRFNGQRTRCRKGIKLLQSLQ
jgi:hypothetical protein